MAHAALTGEDGASAEELVEKPQDALGGPARVKRPYAARGAADAFRMSSRPLIVLTALLGLSTAIQARPFDLMPWVTVEADEAHWRLARLENTRALALLGPSVDESATILVYHSEMFSGSNEDYFNRAAATLQRQFGTVVVADRGQLWTSSLGPLDYCVWSYEAESGSRFQVMYLFRKGVSLHRFEGLGAMAGYESLRGQLDAMISQTTIDPLRQ